MQNAEESTDDALDLKQLVRMKQRTDIRDEATSQFFMLVFLLYPSFTNTIFEGLTCRMLGEDGSVLHVDYSLRCESDSYTMVSVCCVVLLLLWPIGIPTILFYALFSEKEHILAGDPDSLKKFSFAIGDYRTTHWCALIYR